MIYSVEKCRQNTIESRNRWWDNYGKYKAQSILEKINSASKNGNGFLKVESEKEPWQNNMILSYFKQFGFRSYVYTYEYNVFSW
jgi:hypothetical protein